MELKGRCRREAYLFFVALVVLPTPHQRSNHTTGAFDPESATVAVRVCLSVLMAAAVSKFSALARK